MRATLLARLAIAVALSVAAGASESNVITTPLRDLALSANGGLDPLLKKVDSPDLFNGGLALLRNAILGNEDANTNSYLQLIKDLNLNFKVFGAKTTGKNPALGLDYSFERSVVGRTLRPASESPLGLSLTAHAKGNLAFNKDQNPHDFLDSGAAFHLFQSLGGWEPVVQQERPKEGELTEAQKRINKLNPNLDEKERAKDPQWRDFLSYLDQQARTQLFYDASGSFSLESNQSFSQKQFAYGFQVGAVLRAWSQRSALVRWNLFDFPFALIRWLTHADADWSPSGQAIPSLLVGADLVDPYDNRLRLAGDPLHGKQSFPRVRAEMSFKTRLASVNGRDIWMSANLRHFEEINPTALIRAAKLHRQDYVALTVELPYGFNATYSTGRLPLDRKTDEVLALGWRLNF